MRKEDGFGCPLFLSYRIRVSKGLPGSAAWQMAQKICAAKLVLLLYGAFR